MAALDGLNGLAGINAIEEDQPFATPEDRMGGPADPFHGQWGEQAAPYPWESSLGMGGSHGPYGPENQLLGDELWFIESAGDARTDPEFDYNMPNVTHSHGAPHHTTYAGAIPDMADAIQHQLEESASMHASDLNTSRNMSHYQEGEALQDHWEEIWNVTPGNTGLVPIPHQIAGSIAGWGNTDRTQSMARQNTDGYDSAHFHRRIARGSIPGNYMWMRPGGRMMYKNLPGPARPAIGSNSPFEGDDLGQAFGIQGAVLQETPTQYEPPPSPNMAGPISAVPDANGTDGIELW